MGTPHDSRPCHHHNFSATIEDSLQSFDISQYNNIDSALKHLNNVISTANKRHIPSGNIRNYNPTYSRAIKQKILTRSYLRKQTPTPDVIDRIRLINKEIQDDIRLEQQNKWKHLLNTITYNTNPSKLWKLIRGLNNKFDDRTDTHEAILTETNTQIPTDTRQANILNTHYLLKNMQTGAQTRGS